MYFYTLTFILLPIAYTFRYHNRFFSLLLAFFLFILICFNVDNPDYSNYLDYYSNENIADLGYLLLIWFDKNFFNYGHHFILLCLALLFLFLYKKLSGLKLNMFLFSLLYFIFPFPVDLIQVRNTFSLYFFLLSVLMISDKRYFSCSVFLIFSLLFHSFSLIYIFLIVISYFQSIKKIKLLIPLIAFALFSSARLLLEFSISDLGIVNITNYIPEETKIASPIVWTIYIFSILYFFNRISFKDSVPVSTMKLYHTNNLLIKSSLAFIPLLFYMIDFGRFYRSIFILIAINMAILSRHSIRNFLFPIICFFIFISISLIYYTFNPDIIFKIY